MSDNTVQYVDFDHPEQCTKSSPVSGSISIRKSIFWSALLQNIIVVLSRIDPEQYKFITRSLLRCGFNGESTPVLYRSSVGIIRPKELPNNYFIEVNLNPDKIATLIKNFVDRICEKSVRVKIAVQYPNDDSLYPINFNRPEDCLKSKPARCTIDFAFNGRWNQLFLLILEILRTFFPEQYDLLKNEGFTEDSRPLLYKRKPSWMLSPKQLSDGYWVESHGSASALVTRIKSFSDFISDGAARLKIRYVSRNTGASAVKPTPRPVVQPKQAQPKAEPQPEVIEPTQSGNGTQKVDFNHTELCKGTRPVRCMLNGEEVPVGETWRDLLVNVLDALRLLKPSKYDELKEHGFKLSSKPRLSYQPSLMQNPIKKLSDGYYIEISSKIFELVNLIKRFVDYIGEGELPIEILYVPKEDSSESTSDIIQESIDSTISCEYNELKNRLSEFEDPEWIPENNSFEDEDADEDEWDNEESEDEELDEEDWDDEDSNDDQERLFDDTRKELFKQLRDIIINEPCWRAGIEFNSNVKQILSSRCSTELNDGIIEDFVKEYAFRLGGKKDNTFVLFDTVAPLAIQREILTKANDWLEEFRVFQLDCLYNLYKDQLDQIGVIQNLEDFENYLVAAWPWCLDQFKKVVSIKGVKPSYYYPRFVRDSAYRWDSSFEELGKRYTQIVQNYDDSMISQEELCAAIPCIDLSLMDRFISEYAPKLRTCIINDCKYYQTEEAYFSSLSLPNEFPDMLSKVLEQISDCELSPDSKNISSFLALLIGGNFIKRYGISENDDYKEFRDIIEFSYKGTPKRQWTEKEKGEWTFDMVSSDNEEQSPEDKEDESLDESSNLPDENNIFHDSGDLE